MSTILGTLLTITMNSPLDLDDIFFNELSDMSTILGKISRYVEYVCTLKQEKSLENPLLATRGFLAIATKELAKIFQSMVPMTCQCHT